MIMVHGRGASAEDILALAGEFGTTDVAFLAPQAAGHTWYPYSFLAPIHDNEPGISSGLDVHRRPGRRPGRAARFRTRGSDCSVFRRAPAWRWSSRRGTRRRYAAIVGLSGGLIGPPGTPREYPGSLAGAPVFLGCSDVDAHIPLARVRETADVFRRMGASVDERIYPRMGHTVNQDEIRRGERVTLV